MLVASGVTESQVNDALKAVGLVPRLIATGFALACLAVSLLPILSRGDVTGIFLIALPSALIAALSYRVQARVEGSDFVVRSYARTRRYSLRQTESFVDTEYVGFWNRGTGGTWSNFWLRQIDLELTTGRGISLPETIGRGRRVAAAAELLNDFVCRAAHNT